MDVRNYSLAIAAPSFDAPSETFIHDHVRLIAPGETVLLCKRGGGAARFGGPVLADIDPWQAPRTIGARAANAMRHRWRTYFSPGLPQTERRRVVAFLETHGPRALLAEYGGMGLLLAPACGDAGIPIYVHFHGQDASMLLRKPEIRRHYRRLFRLMAGAIVPCRFLADKLAGIGCPAEKLHVNPCGVDPSRFRPGKRVPFRVLAVGRLTSKKGPEKTLAAFGRIAARFPQARLDLIGDGVLAGRCRALIDELGLAGRVVMHGAKDSDFIARQLSKASMFVQHSVTAEDGDAEGLPVAILEAMACALPVVSTRHSGIPEAVEDGITGYLVEEHDIDGMAAAMGEILGDPLRAAAMGSAGRERVFDRFTHIQARDRLRAIMGFPPIASQDAATLQCAQYA